ncbi:MAG: hypothetical protein KDC73_02545 [Ignavibacteriae bacterium]|nr:hypothetical protein [Ignavibacteriota bacterium]MCB9244400.1 hypothetical protein [Ignavibacteriales bacterium]
MEKSPSYSKDTLSEYVLIAIKHKKSLIYTFIASLIISIIIAFFVLDMIYLSTATIKTTSDSKGLSSMLGLSGLDNLGDISSLAGGGSTASELALYENILYSRRCVETAVIKFKIMEEEDFSTMHDALKYFRNDVMEVSGDKIAGTMEVGAFNKDPVKAKEITEYLINELNTINVELKVQDAKNNRLFLGERYNLVKSDLKKAEDSLKTFQSLYGISPDLTVQAAVKTEIEIQAQIASEEVKLEILRKILSSDQAEIKTQEEKISALKKQLNDIQNSSSESGNILTLKGKPDVIMNFLRLKREVEIQNKILTIILPLYEQAKIEENRNTPSILVLDPPFIPDYKTKPKRLYVVLGMTIGITLLVYIIFIAKEKWKNFKKHLQVV